MQTCETKSETQERNQQELAFFFRRSYIFRNVAFCLSSFLLSFLLRERQAHTQQVSDERTYLREPVFDSSPFFRRVEGTKRTNQEQRL